MGSYSAVRIVEIPPALASEGFILANTCHVEMPISRTGSLPVKTAVGRHNGEEESRYSPGPVARDQSHCLISARDMPGAQGPGQSAYPSRLPVAAPAHWAAHAHLVRSCQSPIDCKICARRPNSIPRL